MAYEKERHERKHEYIYRYRKEILFVVVLASLLFATYVVAQFDFPMVDKVLTETPLTEGAGEIGGTIPAVIETNESEEPEIRESEVGKFWREWEIYDKDRFQYYVDRIEIEWYKAPNAICPPGRICPSGRILVDGKPLWNGRWDNKKNMSLNPLDFFENKSRKGNCGITSEVIYELLEVKGEDVREMGAKNINNGNGHAWIEYTDSKGNQWVINFNNVWSKKDWDATSPNTVNLRQTKPRPVGIQPPPPITKDVIVPTPPKK